MWKSVAVAVLGLVGPLLISTPLSAADTHDAPAGSMAHVAADRG